MILQVFCKNYIKEFYFPKIMDGRYYVDIYSYEIDDQENISFFIDISNGIWRINGKNIFKINVKNKYEKEAVLNINDTIIAKMNQTDRKILFCMKDNDASILNF